MDTILPFALLCFTSFFTLTNPLGTMPVFLTMTHGMTDKERQSVVSRATLVAFITIMVFTFAGQFLFKFFGISTNGFRIAGGVIIFKIGFDMLQARYTQMKLKDEEIKTYADDISVTPLGIPMLCGPGAIANAIVLMQDAHTIQMKGVLIGMIAFIYLITFFILRASTRLVKVLGETGNNVMMRETEDAYLVGAATNESGRTIDLPLSFLKKGKYTVEIIEDGEDAHYLTNRESLKVTTRQLTSNDKLTLKLAPGGGACLVIKKNSSMGACGQAAFPLVSPSGKMNADIRAGEKNVEIDLFANGEKVVTAKTLQFSLDENILKGNWKVVDQKRKSVDQTWQPVYGERSVVTDRYNEVELTLQSDENWKEMVLSVRLYDEGLAFR